MGFNMVYYGLIFHDLEVPTLGNLQTASQWILSEQHSRGVSAWDETIDRNQGATACHVSPPES